MGSPSRDVSRTPTARELASVQTGALILWEENLVTLLTQLIQNKARECVLSISSDSGDTVIER